MHDALCNSTTKRAILAEKEASRTPIKIARFTRTADHTKLVVNDITHVTAPNSLECPFQFCQNLDNQTTTTLEKLDEAPEDKLTIFCKVLKLSETKVVGRAKYNVANATIADNTGQITLDVWNNLIPQIQENKVYKFRNLSVRFWNGVRKLTTTTNSIVLDIFIDVSNGNLHIRQIQVSLQYSGDQLKRFRRHSIIDTTPIAVLKDNDIFRYRGKRSGERVKEDLRSQRLWENLNCLNGTHLHSDVNNARAFSSRPCIQPKASIPSLLISNTRSLTCKVDELECDTRQNNADVICVTESWLTRQLL